LHIVNYLDYKDRLDRLMHSPHGFIVTPVSGRRYDNERDVGGYSMIISVSEEDHKYSNRFAQVISTPSRYEGDIKPGDLLLVHHNVFKFYYDMYGKRKSGKSFLKDNEFLIEWDQFFMYKNETGWHTHDKYCFVKPIIGKDMFGNECELPLVGEMKYANHYLTSKGIKNGDKVFIAPDSEYEFQVDGEKLYRVFDHMVAGYANN